MHHIKTDIFISRLHFPVTGLGPGRRLAFWFQGCSRHCHGCLTPDSWSFGQGRCRLEKMLEAAAPWIQQAEGFTITGGEPFDQPEALINLIKRLKELSGKDVLVYTGYEVEEIAPWLDRTAVFPDAVICGPYDSTAGQTKALMGSDNQRLIALTPLGQKILGPFINLEAPKNRRLDILLGPGGEAWLAGIPAPGDLEKLAELLSRKELTLNLPQPESENKGVL